MSDIIHNQEGNDYELKISEKSYIKIYEKMLNNDDEFKEEII